MTGKRFEYNVNKNSIEYDGKHFAYCNVEQSKIAKKLNELNDENIQLQKENKKLKSGYDWEFELRIINGVIDEVDHIIDQRINDVLPKRYHQSNMYFAAKDELANLKKDIHRKIKD